MAFMAANPVLWSTIIAAVGSGTAAAVTSHNAGVVEGRQYKMQAAREGDAARGREVERKRALLRALSQQSARAGAAGIAFEGSPAAAARADIRDASNDLLVDRSNTDSRRGELRSAASNARASGNLRAAGSLFDTGVKVAGQL